MTMTKHYILKFAQVNRDIFESIRSGNKKTETRAATVKYKDIKMGDILTLSCGSEKFEKKVKTARYFGSIKEMLSVYGPQEINPSTSTEEELTRVYHSFSGYEEKIKEFGLIALELED
jgi:ASC-1-like (ASCH) protein